MTQSDPNERRGSKAPFLPPIVQRENSQTHFPRRGTLTNSDQVCRRREIHGRRRNTVSLPPIAKKAPKHDDFAEGMDFGTGETLYSHVVSLPEDEEMGDKISSATFAHAIEEAANEPSVEQITTAQLLHEKETHEAASAVEPSGDYPLGNMESVRKYTGLKRFRAICNMVKNNLAWTRDLNKKSNIEDEGSAYTVKNKDGDTIQVLHFNVDDYQARNKSYGGLSPVCKKILQLPSENRTEEEVDTVMGKVIQRMACFDKYSAKVKRELARVIQYDCFTDGRKIIQQGNKGLSFYFIAKGSVSVCLSTVDAEGIMHHRVIGELSAGSSFGEMALLHDIERTTSIFCKGDSEFIRIDKEDFDAVLKAEYKHDYTRRQMALERMNVFNELTRDNVISISYTCRWRNYPAGTIIRGDTQEVSESVSYIEHGAVKIVREIILWKEILPQGKHRYILKPKNPKNYIARAKARGYTPMFVEESHLFTLFTLKRGCYFGVGEDLTNSYIIAVEPVQVMEVPRLNFNRYGLAEGYMKLRLDFDSSLLDDRDTFKKYMDNQKWLRYKKRVTRQSIKSGSRKRRAKMTDVPLNIRMSDESCE